MKCNYDLNKWGPKIESKNFEDFLIKINTNGVHEIHQDLNPYHILIQDLNLHDKYILVGFHGAIERKKITPPAFVFRNVAKRTNLGLISISDPSLNLSEDLCLGWYLGNEENKNVTLKIANLLDQIIEKTGKKLILSGGSGGGFAALNIHNHMQSGAKAKAFVWNPQTDISNYGFSTLKKYFQVCVDNTQDIDQKYIEEKMEQKRIQYKIDERCDLDQLIFINGYDHAHLRKQVRRYITSSIEKKIRIFVGDWGYGHIQPDIQTVVQVLSLMSNNIEIDDIISKLSKPKKNILDFSKNKSFLEEKLTCRALIINSLPNKVICIKSNIHEHFMAYQISINIRDLSSKIIYRSGYLLGNNISEIYFGGDNSNFKKLKDSIVDLVIEDIYGVVETYSFEYNSIKEFHRFKDKI